MEELKRTTALPLDYAAFEASGLRQSKPTALFTASRVARLGLRHWH